MRVHHGSRNAEIGGRTGRMERVRVDGPTGLGTCVFADGRIKGRV